MLPKALYLNRVLNIKHNEKLIKVSQLNSKESHCFFKARGKIYNVPVIIGLEEQKLFVFS